MKILNVGGATAILEHQGVRMLCDPWLDDGIFHGAWHHWPRTRVGLEDLGHLDYIYISHIHEDHCSAGTIKHLSREAEVIICDHRPNFVANFLEAHEFQFKRVHRVQPMTPYRLTDAITVDMLTAAPEQGLLTVIDSGLILNWDGHVIYNANDCAPHPAGIDYIKKTYGEVDFAMIPYATGSSYPSCFSNLTHEQKLAEKEKLYQYGMKKFVSTIEALQPKKILPFADQYVVVGSRYELNQYMPHPACPGEVKQHYDELTTETELVLLNSGQTYDLASGERTPDAPYEFFSEAEREDYAREHQGSVYDHELFELKRTVPLLRMMTTCRENLWQHQTRLECTPDYRFYVELSDWGKRYEIPLDQNAIVEVEADGTPRPGFLKVTLNSTLLLMMMTGHVSWNIADAALFLDYHREPNVYDPTVHALWNYFRI